MGLNESLDDHEQLASGDLTVCRECGGEWPCLARTYADEVYELRDENAMLRDQIAQMSATHANHMSSLEHEIGREYYNAYHERKPW